MTNYLDRLAALASGTAPVLEPRVPSRFEPAGPPGAAAADDEWGEADAEVEAGWYRPDLPGPPAPPAPLAPPAWSAPVDRGAPAGPAAPWPEPRPATSGAARTTGRGDPDHPATAHDNGSSDSDRAPSPAWSTPAPPPVRDTPTPPPAAPDRATVDRLLALLTELGTETSPGSWRSSRPPAPDGLSRPRPPAPAPPPVAGPAPSRPVPRTAPTAAGLLGPDSARGITRRERHEGPPAVHVHIGRIEVRATAPAPPTPPPAPPAPAPRRADRLDAGAGAPLLEDYLQDPRSRR